MFIRIVIKRRENYDNENNKQYNKSHEDRKKKRARLLLVLAIPIAAIIAVIVFILTQDITLPIRLTDWWTLLHVILFAIAFICYIFAFGRKKDKDDDSDEKYIKREETYALSV